MSGTVRRCSKRSRFAAFSDVLGRLTFCGLHGIRMTDNPHVGGFSETVFEGGFEWQHQHFTPRGW